ncbi:MAG: hypothetical protein SOX38_10960, partial [Candidatus Limiplasma sp.]|nr:hypothetical protein [Candidatus Limiplasma sp.]
QMILWHQHIHTQHLDCLPLFLLSLQHLHHLLLLYQKRPRFATFFDRLPLKHKALTVLFFRRKRIVLNSNAPFANRLPNRPISGPNGY